MKIENENLVDSPIARMNSSNAAFKQLIENLRLKNKNNFRLTLSEANPESEKSNTSQACFSEAQNNSIFEKRMNANTQPLLLNHKNAQALLNKSQDNAIKLKPRGNVGGRDVLNQKPNDIPSSTFNQTVISLKGELKNKNIENDKAKQSLLKEDKVAEDIQINSKLAKITQNKSTVANVSKVLHDIEYAYQHNQKKNSALPMVENNSAVSIGGNQILEKRTSFNQNKLNTRGASNKKIKDIDEELVSRYYRNSEQLNRTSQAKQIFDFFEGLLQIVKVPMQCPLIKKFKNCIYFGHQINQAEKYEGFLYFYDYKIYYGEFFNGQKNGNGVQIIFSNGQALYKGNFSNGQKTGKFYVRDSIKEHEFMGYLDKGVYHGKGKLVTKQFIYQGDFVNGEKHGFGEQYHPRTGVKFTGFFNKGQFQKRSKSNFDRNQLEKGIYFKTGNSRTKEHKKSSSRVGHKNHSHIGLPYNNIQNMQYKNNGFSHGVRERQDDGIETSPFYSSTGFTQVNKQGNHKRGPKAIFNKQKIKSYIPQIKSHFNDAMPQKFQDFDYSFDVSSRRDSQMSQFLPLFDNNAKTQRKKYYQHIANNGNYAHHPHGGYPVSQFPDIEEQKMDTSQCQEPLPTPCFFPSAR